jgi:hypothetical protein
VFIDDHPVELTDQDPLSSGRSGRNLLVRPLFGPNLDNHLDLDRDASGQCVGAKSTPHGYAILHPKNFSEQFTAAVNHLGLLIKVSRAVDEPKRLDQALDLIEAAERISQSCQQGQSGLPGRCISPLEIHGISETPSDERTVLK